MIAGDGEIIEEVEKEIQQRDCQLTSSKGLMASSSHLFGLNSFPLQWCHLVWEPFRLSVST